ncbi:MAG: F0F1 ATP synthase subunit epsilon, partial [Pseudomonadales bacterium]|nr:F0F1 ATP synthase subunit epsilon [Pseudomonadales bacterium]
MLLNVLMPSRMFLNQPGVERVVVETTEGLFGLLPRRLDCVAALQPGILIYQCAGGGETYVAVDAGVLVKVGSEITVSVRNAVGGSD